MDQGKKKKVCKQKLDIFLLIIYACFEVQSNGIPNQIESKTRIGSKVIKAKRKKGVGGQSNDSFAKCMRMKRKGK